MNLIIRFIIWIDGNDEGDTLVAFVATPVFFVLLFAASFAI